MFKYKTSIIKVFIALLIFVGHPLYSGNAGEIPLRAKFFVTMCVFVPTLGTYNMVINWSDATKRFLMLEDVILALLGLLVMIDFIFSPNNYKIMIDIMRNSTFKEGTYATKSEIDKTRNKTNTFSWNLFFTMYSGMVIFWTFICAIPFCNFIILLNTDRYIDYENAAMPVPSFIIFKINNDSTVFTIYFIVQEVILGFFLLVIGLWALLTSCSLAHVSYELGLLCVIIKSIDEKVGWNGTGFHYDENVGSVNLHQHDYDQRLKRFLTAIHHYHLTIIQKIKTINRVLKIPLFIYNYLICIHISVMLYCIFQNNDFSGKGKYIFALVSTTVNYGISCATGQFLINMSERLWEALMECSWDNKPIWFKHSIKTLLIGTLRPLELKPAGLYVLDLDFLVKVLRAAYSYCNIMLQFNIKKELA